jgi:hypothetical protein
MRKEKSTCGLTTIAMGMLQLLPFGIHNVDSTGQSIIRHQEAKCLHYNGEHDNCIPAEGNLLVPICTFFYGCMIFKKKWHWLDICGLTICIGVDKFFYQSVRCARHPNHPVKDVRFTSQCSFFALALLNVYAVYKYMKHSKKHAISKQNGMYPSLKTQETVVTQLKNYVNKKTTVGITLAASCLRILPFRRYESGQVQGYCTSCHPGRTQSNGMGVPWFTFGYVFAKIYKKKVHWIDIPIVTGLGIFEKTMFQGLSCLNNPEHHVVDGRFISWCAIHVLAITNIYAVRKVWKSYKRHSEVDVLPPIPLAIPTRVLPSVNLVDQQVKCPVALPTAPAATAVPNNASSNTIAFLPTARPIALPTEPTPWHDLLSQYQKKLELAKNQGSDPHQMMEEATTAMQCIDRFLEAQEQAVKYQQEGKTWEQIKSSHQEQWAQASTFVAVFETQTPQDAIKMCQEATETIRTFLEWQGKVQKWLE